MDSADEKQLRDERKADLERHVKEINALMPATSLALEAEDSDEEGKEADGWNGIEEVALEPVDHEAEYVDEDKYTTVTVEEVDISRDGISRRRGGEDEGGTALQQEAADLKQPANPSTTKKPPSKREKDKKPRKKKKTFRYESPAERKMNRLKVRAKNSKAAQARRGD